MKKIYLFIFLFLSIFLSGCTLDQTEKPAQVRKYPSGVFKSVDSGKTWDSKSFVENQGGRIVSIADSLVYSIEKSPINNSMIVSTKNNGLYISRNSAENWSPFFTIGKNVKAFSFDASDPNIFYVGHQNVLYKTKNSGEKWTPIYTDPESNIVSVRSDNLNPKDVYVFLSDGRILKTSDSLTFKVIYDFTKREIPENKIKRDAKIDLTSMFGIRDVYFYEKNINTYYVVTNNGDLYVTKDLGYSFSEIERPGKLPVRFLTIYPSSASNFILVIDSGIYKTQNGGEEFEEISILTNSNKRVSALAVGSRSPNLIYYALGDLIYKTTNGGNTWMSIPSPVTRMISYLKIDSESQNTIYLGADIDGRLVQRNADTNLFCELFGIIFPQFCK